MPEAPVSKEPIGINGLGRIGRLAVRKLAAVKPSRLAAVNDPADLKTLVHLLRYDSVHVHNHLQIEGFNRDGQDVLRIEGHEVPVYHEKDPSNIPWENSSVCVVIEASGRFTKREGAQRHLGRGVQRVIISAPSPDADRTIMAPIPDLPIKGVRIGSFRTPPREATQGSEQVLSNASCTAHATAPMLYVLERDFGIAASTMSTVHVATNDQRLLDAPHPDLRRARAAMVGIHPTTSSAFNALKQALPWVLDDFDGWAIRVPTLSVNLVDLTVVLKTETTVDRIREAYERAAQQELKGILGIAEAPLVSCDFTGREESVVMDLELTRLLGGRFLKVFGWHDNEIAYAARLCEVAQSVTYSKCPRM